MTLMIKPLSPILLLLVATLLLLSASTATASAAFNITRLLGQHPEFGAFNDYLTQTNVSDLINHRQTITVLALDNRTVAALAGKPLVVVKDILCSHVVLDFLGIPKLRGIILEKRTAVFATLLQATGRAAGRQGFVTVSAAKDDGVIAFASAVDGSPLTVKLVGSVAVKPYNISVLHVSTLLVPPGVDPNPSPPPPPAPAAEEDSPAEAPAPTSDEEVADAPVADSPEAYAPVADGPEANGMSPSETSASSPAEMEVSDTGVDVEISESEKSGASKIQMGSVVSVGVMIRLLSFLVTL
ncbi:hypothetical protein TIFTF001_009051 [Ficus carica]|uniref:FAS1 domain-containing protein n=1 Tax=Ficus carica TaxID=3494 RepID=A0AA87ZT82_FICCA|nr:hypothetical protein TIFTF001_009051 [Ficus carica]